MKDTTTKFTVNGKTYKLVFNLYVIQKLQIKYASVQKWGELTDKKNGEINVEALLFGFTEMLNEAIDIDNEEKNISAPFLTEKQVGRLITSLGIEETNQQIQKTVIESTNVETSKNV